MNNEIAKKTIELKILTIRNQQMMIDRDLAELYGTETKVLNQAVKSKIERFPEDFMFSLNETEKEELVTNCDRFETMKHSSTMPYAFMEQDVAAKMHDSFMIIDKKTLYHIGASFKDLGKKCFAFEVLDASLIGHLLKNV